MQSLLVGGSRLGLCGGFEHGISPCIVEDFGRVSGRVLEDSLQEQRRALRDSVDPQGGCFSGVSHFKKVFWSFLGLLSKG